MGDLHGQAVVITRAAHQAGEMADLVRQRGAEPIVVPAIAVEATRGAEGEAADAALQKLGSGTYDALLLTSANAVRYMLERFVRLGISASQLQRTHIFAIGKATAAALVQGDVRNVIVARRAVSEGMLDCVQRLFGDTLPQRKLLLPRAREGRDTMIEGLRVAGATVDVVALYETVLVEEGATLPTDRRIDWVTFTSPSSVRGFLHRHRLPEGARVACIGGVTADAAREHGLRVDVVPAEHTIGAMLDAMQAAATGAP